VSRKDGSKGITLEVQTPVVENPLKLIYNPDGIELNHSDTMTARFLTDGQTLEFKNGQTSTVTLTADTIQLKEAAIEVQITNSSIALTCTPATLKLSTSSGIEMGNTPASIKVSSSGVETSSGGLGSIAISLGSVSINNGALEVT
jgi:P pilus assembly chaperone PapD